MNTPKKLTSLLMALLVVTQLLATQTTYTFTNATWNSQVGTVTTNGTSDGWVSDKDAADYSSGYPDRPLGLTDRGVKITTGYSGAGATSILSFVEVRKVVVNYCTNNKKGKGTINVQVGDNEPQSVTITPPSDNGGVNRDVEIVLPETQTGKVKFWVTCTENSIYINTITIKASNGSPNISGLTADVFQLVTNVNDLQDGDEIIFGVSGTQYNYIMGLYDEYNSRNNIYAIKGTYSADRQSVNPNANAVYTLLKGEIEGEGNYYAFLDITDYFLVASGGNPNSGNNNYLTVWDTISSDNYGDYGAWDITIAANGEASIVNLGKSRSGKLQFNPNGGTPIFACYADWSQTMPAIYKRITIDNPTAPYITAPLCNFSTVLLSESSVSGSKTIEVNAVNLTEDISASLVRGTTFALDKSVLDRDGDHLTISFTASAVGDYRDTLVLRSTDTELRACVLLNVDRELTVAEACQLADLTTCYLNPVVITKKYDKYVFVKDDTGSILLFDNNHYAQDRKNGDILSGVVGKFKNYYGNPDINLTIQFSYKSGNAVLPERQTQMPDSVDVCKYLRFEKVQYNAERNLLVNGSVLPIYDLFNYQSKGVVTTGQDYDVEGIVYFYNEVVFCPTNIEVHTATSAETLQTETSVRKYISNGEVLMHTTSGTIDMRGNQR